MSKKSNNEKVKKTAYDIIIQDLKNKFGMNSIITPKDVELMDKYVVKKNVIPSGSFSFDRLTGVGGLPKGRIFLIYGNKGIGKTTTSLSLYINAAKQGYQLVFCDTEHRLDVSLLDAMGIDRYDVDKFALSRSKWADEVFETIYRLLQLGRPLFIIMDSITALRIRPSAKKKEDESTKDYLKGTRMGKTAASLGEFLNDISPLISSTQSIFIMISQERYKGIGRGMAYKSYTGGEAPGFYATYIWYVKKEQGGEIIKDNQIIGQELVWEFKKTTTSLPPNPRRIALHYGKGFYPEYELAKIGVQNKLIEVSGSWVTYKDVKKQGFMNFVTELENNKKLFQELKKDLNIK